ncbi:enhancer of mRNA-decapping protein 4 homolog isoform X1 [Aedes albopictus]|uniref:Enhancer of mRNA-decapping protein 4 WD40 repeat region domain-containing protein n=2 Tax=Aedes albopictus TaxID=7160 RepID=A0ABM1Z0V4_AEDAL|nr:enhancer of mRNA-decapping protein 4 homolog isoform X1 [Aedes albopictus]
MLIVILIGTVQLGRFVRGLLWSSEERAASEQQSSRSPVQVVRRVGSAIRSVLGGMDGVVGKMGGSVSSSASGTSGTKTIIFNKDKKQQCIEVGGQDATIVGGTGKHDHGSSRVKLVNIVDYKWEQKHYPGRLIACHNEGKLIAYAIKVPSRAVPEGMVRILHLVIGQRALIKGMKSEVLDLQFAHISSKVLLGIIDKVSLQVHKVDVVSEKVVCTLLLKINDPIESHIPVCDKISWCPYLSGSGFVDDYASQLLVWTRGGNLQCYSVSTVIRNYGTGELAGSDISDGGFKFRETLPLITGAIFSADGTTLAVSCDDGVIRFYQVYQHTNDNNPRCLHQWKPHGGKSISSFFFLDNYTEESGDQTLWKHAITCAENNTEIKVWSCETWECTQTIKFSPSIDQPLSFLAEIDSTSSYLILADMATRELYVLQIRKEAFRSAGSEPSSITNGKSSNDNSLNGSKTGDGKEPNATMASMVSSTTSNTNAVAITKAFVSSVAEFPLPSPILSFGILNVAVRKFKTSDAYLIEALDDYDEEENSSLYSVVSVVIRMYLVQPKSVQECMLFYQPSVALGTEVLSTLSSNSSEYRNISQSSSGSVSSSAKKDDQLTTAAEIANRSLGSGDGDTLLDKSGSKLASESLLTEVGGGGGGELGRIRSSPNVTVSAAVATVPSSTGSSGSNGATVAIAVAVSATNSSGSVGSNAGVPQKPTINLMTPDSFSSSAEKTEKHKNDDAVNPNVLSTLFMLANVTKQQQQQQQQQRQSTGESPNDSYKDKPSPLNMLNIVNSTMIEEQEQAKVRQSVELQQKALLETPPVPPMPSAEMLASGGSSPSREVQEILSLKDNDCLNEYYDSDNILLDETDGIGADDDELNDLENEINDDDDEDEGYNFKNIDDDDDDDVLQQRKVQSVSETSKAAQNLKEIKPINKEQGPSQEKLVKSEPTNNIDWPAVPEVPHPPSAQPLPPPPQPPMIVTVPQNSKQLDDLTQKMDRLLDVVQEQSHQISGLRSQIHELNRARLEDAKAHHSEITKIQAMIPGAISKTYKDAQASTSILMQRQPPPLPPQMPHPQILVQQIVEHIRPMIAMELPKQVQMIVGAKLDGMVKMFQNDLLKWKVQTNDNLVKMNVERMCRSQALIDALNHAVEVGVKTGLEKLYADSLHKIILPANERVLREIFIQLTYTFAAGTKEYLQKLDQYIGQKKQFTDRTDDVLELVKKIPDQVNTNTDQQFKANTTMLREDITRDFKLLQTSLLKVIRDNIRHEIEKGLEAQASSLEDSVLSAVRSQAQTPAPSSVDIHEQIRLLLASGQINQAFHKALLSNDLSLVEFTLEKADYKQVFNPCPLEQTVLLSLIQQISADMANYNELKHRYLSDSIVSLNFSDPITKEHAPKVMRELTQNCQTFLSSNPGHPLATSIKMLMIATQGLQVYKQF